MAFYCLSRFETLGYTSNLMDVGDVPGHNTGGRFLLGPKEGKEETGHDKPGGSFCPRGSNEHDRSFSVFRPTQTRLIIKPLSFICRI